MHLISSGTSVQIFHSLATSWNVSFKPSLNQANPLLKSLAGFLYHLSPLKALMYDFLANRFQSLPQDGFTWGGLEQGYQVVEPFSICIRCLFSSRFTFTSCISIRFQAIHGKEAGLRFRGLLSRLHQICHHVALVMRCKELLMNGSMAEIKRGFLLAAAEGRSQWQQFRRTMGEAPADPRLPSASKC